MKSGFAKFLGRTVLIYAASGIGAGLGVGIGLAAVAYGGSMLLNLVRKDVMTDIRSVANEDELTVTETEETK